MARHHNHYNTEFYVYGLAQRKCFDLWFNGYQDNTYLLYILNCKMFMNALVFIFVKCSSLTHSFPLMAAEFICMNMHTYFKLLIF